MGSWFRLKKRFVSGHRFTGCAEKLAVDPNATTGLKPASILEASRGAEAPLFHGTARIGEFFRNLCMP
jgi:hypothetical protein